MKAIKVISPAVVLLVVICHADRVSSEPIGYKYGPPPKQEETEVEIIQVEVSMNLIFKSGKTPDNN